jgi:hypothetical protein
MTEIHNNEIEPAGKEIEPAGKESAVVRAEASAGPPTSSDPPDIDDDKGGKKRKAPKAPKAKNVTAAEKDGGYAGATVETALNEQARESEQGGANYAADDVLASYPNLGAWPVSAGPAPLPAHISIARALGMGPGTKRELAVAAYLRDDAGQYTLIQVADALRAVLGGEFNVQRNVVKGLEADGLVKLNKVTTEGVGTSFHLELTSAGAAQLKKWLAQRDHRDFGDSSPS